MLSIIVIVLPNALKYIVIYANNFKGILDTLIIQNTINFLKFDFETHFIWTCFTTSKNIWTCFRIDKNHFMIP